MTTPPPTDAPAPETPRMTDDARPTPLIDDTELARMSPEKLVSGFTRTPVLIFALVAVGLHLVVILGTSMPFIYSTWVSPPASATISPMPSSGPQQSDDAEAAPPGSADATATDGPSRIEQRVEEAAEPDDIPSLDDLMDTPN